MTIRILVVDRQPIAFHSTQSQTDGCDTIECIGRTTSPSAALHMACATPCDAIVLDVEVADRPEHLIRDLRVIQNPPRVLVLTLCEDTVTVLNSLRSGAQGYLLKSEPLPVILDGIRMAHRGITVLSEAVASKLAADGRESQAVAAGTNHATALRPREREVLRGLATGATNKEIAMALGISERTVRNYVARIYDVLEVHSRSEAVAWAWHHGLTAPLQKE